MDISFSQENSPTADRFFALATKRNIRNPGAGTGWRKPPARRRGEEQSSREIIPGNAVHSRAFSSRAFKQARNPSCPDACREGRSAGDYRMTDIVFVHGMFQNPKSWGT